jgi:WbqC-like protein family
MILGIMQPYFFPYLGHYQLILATERWVVFDLVRYSRRSWMNRNRVLHPTEGWQYVNVPVRDPQDKPLAEVTVVDAAAARRRILGQLAHYRGKAPYFAPVCGLVDAVFANTRTDKLRDLNIQSLNVVCDYLSIPFTWSICSDLDLDFSGVDHAGQWALEISDALGASRYINPSSGREIFRPKEWVMRGIELRFIHPRTMRYETPPYKYQDDLSILDVLMWNEKTLVRKHLSETITITE